MKKEWLFHSLIRTGDALLKHFDLKIQKGLNSLKKK